MIRAASQSPATIKTDASETVIHTECKRDLTPHPRLRYKVRRESDAENCHLSVGGTGVARFGSEAFNPSWNSSKSVALKRELHE